MDRMKGVVFNEPPPHLLDKIRARAIAETGALGPTDSGAIVLIPTTTGINGAVVAKFNRHWFVTGYIGKEWGEPIDVAGGIKFQW